VKHPQFAAACAETTGRLCLKYSLPSFNACWANDQETLLENLLALKLSVSSSVELVVGCRNEALQVLQNEMQGCRD
jgi:hypothetical protein